MERKINKAEAAAVKVNNISPAAMKVILEKIKGPANPGADRGVFVKGPTDFAQSDGFAKFSRPGETAPIISIQDDGGFKMNAEIVKGLEQR